LDITVIIGKINIDEGIFLAPMEDVTDLPFRLICKRMGADIVYTEFVNSEGLVRSRKKSHHKLDLSDEERPVAIQIYGSDIGSMAGAARIAEAAKPDFIDINAGCWVKDIAGRGAGAGLLRDLPRMEAIAREVRSSVSLPVTLKTRLGWDADSIHIVEVAKMLQDAGISALTIHCRTRSQGHKGEPDWSWIQEVKKHVSIPIIANGGIDTPERVEYVLRTIGADAVMIGQGAIDNPWIFKQAKHYRTTRELLPEPTVHERIALAIEHLHLSTSYKGEHYGAVEMRKHYSGYLKGLHNGAKLRIHLMQFIEAAPIEEALRTFADRYEDSLTEPRHHESNTQS
jgi:tRNA-dihydrouridine synthase B